MQNENKNLSERLLDFAASIIKLASKLNKLQPLLEEADELVKIIAKSVITAKARGK